MAQEENTNINPSFDEIVAEPTAKENIPQSYIEGAPKKDSTQGSDMKKLIEDNHLNLNIIEPKSEKDENGNSKKTFENPRTKVVITNKRHSVDPYKNVRDVVVKVEKGPAVVSLAMTNTKGKKAKGQNFIMEFGKEGNLLTTMPDLRLVQFEKPDPNKPSIAFLQDANGEKVFLPVNGDVLKAHKTALNATRQHSTEELIAKEIESGISAPDPDLNRIASLTPQAKTPQDITKEYANMLMMHYETKADVEGFPLDAKKTAALKESEKKLEEYNSQHISPNMDQERQNVNRKAVEEATKLASFEFKNNATKRLINAINSEIRAGMADNAAGVDFAVSNELKATRQLKAMGVSVPEINKIEKTTVNHSLTKAVAAEMDEIIDGNDRVGSVLQKRAAMFVGARMGMPEQEMHEHIAASAASNVANHPDNPAYKVAAEQVVGSKKPKKAALQSQAVASSATVTASKTPHAAQISAEAKKAEEAQRNPGFSLPPQA